MSADNKNNKMYPVLRGMAPWLICLGMAILAVMVFRAVLPQDVVLFSTDNNIGSEGHEKSLLPHGFVAQWSEFPFIGSGAAATLNWTNMLLWLLPLNFYIDWIHAIDLVLASLFLIAFLRLRGCPWPACILSFLTAFWLGTNLTLTYAGHNGKYGVLLFAAISLWCIEKASQTRRVGWAILAGGAVGGMFIEQQDVALFFGIFWGAYAVYSVVRKDGWNTKALLLRLIPMGLAALLIAGVSTFRIYTLNVEGVATVSEETNPQAKWDFATSWSVPPRESLDFIAPGFYGWRSDDPQGPYWGKTGQSPEWEKAKQGFKNFRLEGVYIGAIPVILALFAVFIAVLNRRRCDSSVPECQNEYGAQVNGEEWRSDVFFWGAVTITALLLSFGRYFPLYSLFYHLPVISSIRCPNKLLHVFQVSLAILSAYGLSMIWQADPPAVLRSALWAGKSRQEADKSHKKRIRGFVYATALLGLLLFIYAGIVVIGRGVFQQNFVNEGLGQAAPLAVNNMIKALAHGGIMTLLCGGAVLLIYKSKAMWRTASVWGLIAAVVLDVFLLARHYIKPINIEANAGENAVTKYLKANLGLKRVYFLTREGFYNNWLTILIPYHHISAFNPLQTPRLAEDYKRFLSIGNKNPIRLWQLSSIGYMLAPAQAWSQISKDPKLKDHFEQAFGFNVFPYKDGLGVSESSPNQPPQHMILKFKSGLPRYSLIGNWETVPDDAVCRRLAAFDFNPVKKALIASNTAKNLPAPESAQEGLATLSNKIDVISYRPGRVALKASAEVPSILLATEKYEPGWNVWVDGRKEDLLRCNFICQGVYLNAGEHKVVFQYGSGMGLLWIQFAGMAICLGAGLQLIFNRRK